MSKRTIYECDGCSGEFLHEKGLLQISGLHFCTKSCFETYARDTWDAWVDDGDINTDEQYRYDDFRKRVAALKAETADEERALADQAESAAAGAAAAEALEASHA